MKPYYVWSPPYRHNSGGIRALYLLAEKLKEAGYEAYNTLDKPSIDEYIAVYPEIVHGNPWNAPRVARWVLNRPAALGGDKVYDDKELVFSHNPLFLPFIENKVSGILFLPDMRAEFYRDDNVRKSNIAYYVGKGKYIQGIVPEGARQIVWHDPPEGKFGDFLRTCNTLYCFDNLTGIVHEAAMCGCISIIIPDGTYERENYVTSGYGLFGIAWGTDEKEIQWAKDSIKYLPRFIDLRREEAKEQLKNFIEVTQND